MRKPAASATPKDNEVIVRWNDKFHCPYIPRIYIVRTRKKEFERHFLTFMKYVARETLERVSYYCKNKT